MTQRKAVYRIKKNAALEQLCDNYSGLPNLVKVNEQIEKASTLGGDDLQAYIKELKVEARQNNWYTIARQKYVDAKHELRQERKLIVKKFGYFSNDHFVAWVKLQVLKNVAKKAGVAGFRYQIKKLFGRTTK